MGKRFLIDTNIVSKYFQRLLSEEGRNLIRTLNDDAVFISVINRIELLGWNINDDDLEASIKNFVESVSEIPLDESIIVETIKIRKRVKIKLPDAIIAATAIVHGLTLLSDNDFDFLKVPRLKYLNPTKEEK